MLEQTWCKCCTLIPGKIRDCWSRIIFRYIDKSEGYSRHLVKESWNLVREGGWVVYGMFARVMETRREKCFAGLFANGTAYEMARSVSTIPFPWRQTVDINAFLPGNRTSVTVARDNRQSDSNPSISFLAIPANFVRSIILIFLPDLYKDSSQYIKWANLWTRLFLPLISSLFPIFKNISSDRMDRNTGKKCGERGEEFHCSFQIRSISVKVLQIKLYNTVYRQYNSSTFLFQLTIHKS